MSETITIIRDNTTEIIVRDTYDDGYMEALTSWIYSFIGIFFVSILDLFFWIFDLIYLTVYSIIEILLFNPLWTGIVIIVFIIIRRIWVNIIDYLFPRKVYRIKEYKPEEKLEKKDPEFLEFYWEISEK